MANLNAQTISTGVDWILSVENGIDASTARQVKDGDGTVSPFYLTTTKVGIGASSPVQELEVVGDIAVMRTDVSATRYVGITQSNGDMLNSTASIGFISDGTDQQISFHTHNSGSSSGERMRIDEDGKVGIGETDPDQILTVKGSAPYIHIKNTAEGLGGIKFSDSEDVPGQHWLFEMDCGTMDFKISADGSGGSVGNVLYLEHDTGHVGIGCEPEEMLHLKSSGSTDPTIRIENTNNDTNSPNIVFMKNPGDNQEGDGDVLGTIRFNGQDDGDVETEYASIYSESKDVTGGTEDGSLVFRTLKNASLYNSMIIHGANIGLGTDPTHRMHMYGNGATQSYFISTSNLNNGESSRYYASGGGNSVTRYAEFGVHYNSSGTTNAPCGYVRLDTGDNSPNYLWVDDSDDLRISTASAHIGTANGSVVGDQSSDERIKNISSDAFPYGLTEINKLKPIKFTYKSNSSVNKLGFGAQTTQSILPETVKDTKELLDGYKMEKDSDGNETNQKAKTDKTDTILSMEYVQIIPVLVKAVQELSAKVTALENK